MADAKFVNISGEFEAGVESWPSVLITKEDIDREIERLADEPPSGNGCRVTSLVHPLATAPGLGLAPGIDARLEVLKPGEHTRVSRSNSSSVGTCILGNGMGRVGTASFGIETHDVWNTPSMHPIFYENNGRGLMARLTFSNKPLLEKLMVYFAEEADDSDLSESWFKAVAAGKPSGPRAKDSAPVVSIGGSAYLMPYEHLVDPDTVDNHALHWPWSVVEPALKNVHAIGEGYTGRRLYILYNPATERRNGVRRQDIWHFVWRDRTEDRPRLVG